MTTLHFARARLIGSSTGWKYKFLRRTRLNERQNAARAATTWSPSGSWRQNAVGPGTETAWRKAVVLNYSGCLWGYASWCLGSWTHTKKRIWCTPIRYRTFSLRKRTLTLARCRCMRAKVTTNISKTPREPLQFADLASARNTRKPLQRANWGNI